MSDNPISVGGSVTGEAIAIGHYAAAMAGSSQLPPGQADLLRQTQVLIELLARNAGALPDVDQVHESAVHVRDELAKSNPARLVVLSLLKGIGESVAKVTPLAEMAARLLTAATVFFH
jgi:hypothetical protein